jgi:hypothetical protein
MISRPVRTNSSRRLTVMKSNHMKSATQLGEEGYKGETADPPHTNHQSALTPEEHAGDSTGWVKSSDIKCTLTTCIFNDHHPEILCVTGWSIAVLNCPQGEIIGWLATTDYPNVPSKLTVMIKGETRNGYTFVSFSKGNPPNVFYPSEEENKSSEASCG